MIAEIEDAIINQVKTGAQAAGFGYKIATVDSYGGELDGMLDEVIRKMPAVWVTFAGSGKPVPLGTKKDKFLFPCTFATMVGARNVRGERSTRHGLTVNGNVVEVGVYQMLEDVRLMLMGQDFGLAIDRLVPGAVKTLYNTKLNGQSLAVFAQEWHTKFVVTQPRVPIDPTDPDWLYLTLNYNLMPDDGKTDASDSVTLS